MNEALYGIHLALSANWCLSNACLNVCQANSVALTIINATRSVSRTPVEPGLIARVYQGVVNLENNNKQSGIARLDLTINPKARLKRVNFLFASLLFKPFWLVHI